LDHFEDGAVPATRHTFSRIEEHIRESEPWIIFTHFDRSGADDHQDHQVVGRVVLNLALRYSTASFVLQVEPPSAGSGFRPNVFVDITNYIDTKIQALGAYKSEADKVFMSEEAVRLRGNWWARHAVLSEFSLDTYYEPFVLVTARLDVKADALIAAAALNATSASALKTGTIEKASRSL
jgi:LmbE family N-acetylglucosaminyl deacetylase